MRYLITLLLASLLASPVAWGQDDDPYAGKPRWFQFEVLLFRNLSAAAQYEESWLTEINLRMAQPSYELPEIGSGSANFRLWQPPTAVRGPAFKTPPGYMLQYRGANAGDATMQAIRTRLQSRGNYRAIDFRVWRAQLASDGTPIYFHVAAGSTSGGYPELEGYIGFQLKRYLHVDANLWWGDFSPPAPAADDSVAPAQPETADTVDRYDFRRAARAGHIQEQRRMRSGETHYFDHPLFGMLVRISPWQAAP
jgi:hypothetical protein